MATRTRNRTRGLAVLDSSVRRKPSSPFTSRSRSPFKRRAVVVGLAVLSLALITASFRETSGGHVHGAQNVVASAMRPFEVAADRVARPFRDAYGWFDGLVTARSENTEAEERPARRAPALRRRAVRAERERDAPEAPRLPARAALPEGLPRRQRQRGRARADGRAAADHGLRRHEPGRPRGRSRRHGRRPRRQGHAVASRRRAGDAAHRSDERGRGGRPADERVRARPARARAATQLVLDRVPRRTVVEAGRLRRHRRARSSARCRTSIRRAS